MRPGSERRPDGGYLGHVAQFGPIGPFLAVLFLALVAFFATPVLSQENDDCLMCHQDPDLTGERGGRELSVFVDEEALADSAHAGLDCVVCHQDLESAELPHDQDVEQVDCGFCHDSEAADYGRSLHGQALARGDELAPSCSDCHGRHDIQPSSAQGSATALMNIPLLCGRCHHAGEKAAVRIETEVADIVDSYTMSIHGKGLLKSGLLVMATCNNCHTTHRPLPPEDPRSTLSRRNVVDTCSQCHDSANRRFAGYLTHTPHHDPQRYPWLYWTFWGMTTLLVGT